MQIHPRHIKSARNCLNSCVSVLMSIMFLCGPGNVPLFVSTANAARSEIIAPTGPMVVARQGHTATVLTDGRVLIAGGTDAGTVLVSAEVFDPHTRTFALVGEMAGAPFGHTA